MATTRGFFAVPGAYRTPDGKRAARYARIQHRFTATVIDGMLCFFIFFFTALVTSLVGNQLNASEQVMKIIGIAWIIIFAVEVLAYFTYGISRGRTVGMQLLRIRIINPDTGEPPRPLRALARASITVVVGAALYILLNYVLSAEMAEGDTTISFAISVVAFVIFLAGMWGNLWMLFDIRAQSAADRLTNVVFLDGEMIDIPEDLVILTQERARELSLSADDDEGEVDGDSDGDDYDEPPAQPQRVQAVDPTLLPDRAPRKRSRRKRAKRSGS